MNLDQKPPQSVERIRDAKEKLDEHLAVLAEQMQQGLSTNLVRYLEVCARLHSYSFRNIVLALSQRADISQLAGIRTWNRLGRNVKRGEKGIAIFAPMTCRRRPVAGEEKDEQDSSENHAELVTRFRIVYVFDVAQTEGKELPQVVRASGDVHECLPALEHIVRESGIDLEYVTWIWHSRTALGTSLGGRILVRSELAPADTFRVLVHEFAHELLHWKADHAEESKTVVETEADAIAFVVCRHFGIECDTADYLALQASSPKVLLERLELIRQTAAEIIDAVDLALPSRREVVLEVEDE